MSELERELVWVPAFDRRNTDPQKDYGIHGVELRFYVHGPAGVAQFILFCNWQRSDVRREFPLSLNRGPLPADVGFHRRTPGFKGETEAASQKAPSSAGEKPANSCLEDARE